MAASVETADDFLLADFLLPDDALDEISLSPLRRYFKRHKMKIYGAFFILYYGIGILFYMLHEHYSFTNAVYFITVSISTIGAINDPPKSSSGRAFTCLFILCGILLLWCFCYRFYRIAVKQRESWLMNVRAWVLENHEARISGGSSLSSTETASIYCMQRGGQSVRGIFMGCSVVVMLLCFAFSFWTLERSEQNELTFGDSFYFAIITLTTVGFGDIDPKTTMGKWMIILSVPFSVFFLSTTLSQIVRIILRVDEREAKKMVNVRGNLTVKNFLRKRSQELAKKGMQLVEDEQPATEFEYIAFMLTTAGLVPRSTMDALHANYERIAASGVNEVARYEINQNDGSGAPSTIPAQPGQKEVESQQNNTADDNRGVSRGISATVSFDI